MSGKNLKVLFVSAEAAPFSTVGGLGQVAYFLPRALMKLGVDVRIFIPKYGTINEEKFPTKKVIDALKVPTGEKEGDKPRELICNVKAYAETRKNEPTVYFLENMEYFEKRANVYGYSDDNIRFGLLSRGALEFIKHEFFVPDIIHANDWHTAYTLNFLRQDYKDDPVLKKIAGLMSVHNLFQGQGFDFAHASEMDFDDGKSRLAPFFSDQFFKQNSLKRGIIYADVVNTVSETYARDIMKEEYGWGLDKLFKELRGKLFGVLNGIDYTDFNPATDKLIKKNYSAGNFKARVEDKADLQKEFNLKDDPNAMVLAISGRLDEQKGIDLVMETMQFILDEFPVQFIVLGSPAKDEYRKFFEELEKKYPGRVGTHLQPNFALPRKIFAGADVILMPSKYEPGGIVALEAMRYGCVPVVRATGGLNDSVSDGVNGFKFNSYAGMAFLSSVARALEIYKNKVLWQKMVKKAMEADFSWAKAAEKYLDLYSRTLEFRKEALSPNPPQAFKQVTS
ncbi:glycogen synthase [Patescibacteria group bacterium]|nr:glycogen synthase [Patescibacteria group bacterium]